MNEIMLLSFVILFTTPTTTARVSISPKTQADLYRLRSDLCSDVTGCRLKRRRRTERQIGSTCCGHCSCDTICHKYGDCCIDIYASMDEARVKLANLRYGCVQAQYLPATLTKYSGAERYWMVTKCDSDTNNKTLVSLCETPNHSNAQLDQHLPVTDMMLRVHYRNKYCAMCNAAESYGLFINWYLLVYNDEIISFPDTNFLSVINTSKGNVFFVPPAYATVDDCFIRSYTISTCNVTGHWLSYNELLDLSCRLFLDPFNITFKNPFCYLCNAIDAYSQETIKSCKHADIEVYGVGDAPFKTFVDADNILQPNGDQLSCDQTQFRDQSQMLCRQVLCHMTRDLENGACWQRSVGSEICYNIFFKLIPLVHDEISANGLDGANIHHFIKTMLEQEIPGFGETIMSMQIYSYLTEDIETFNMYLVASVVIDPCPSIYNCLHTETIFSLYNLHKTFNVKVVPNMYVDVFIEAVHMNVPLQDDADYFSTPSWTKVYESIKNESNTCLQKKLATFKLTHICPFLSVNRSEEGVTFHNEKDALVISDPHGKRVTLLDFWKFEDFGDRVHMCLVDYMYIYRNKRQQVSKLKTGWRNHTIRIQKALYLLIIVISTISFIELSNFDIL